MINMDDFNALSQNLKVKNRVASKLKMLEFFVFVYIRVVLVLVSICCSLLLIKLFMNTLNQINLFSQVIYRRNDNFVTLHYLLTNKRPSFVYITLTSFLCISLET